MNKRVNKTNKPVIIDYIINRFTKIAKKNNNKISIIDIWDVQFELEIKFEISEYQSEKITKLIEITELLTKRCIKIEKNAIEGISALNKRIAELEEREELH